MWGHFSAANTADCFFTLIPDHFFSLLPPTLFFLGVEEDEIITEDEEVYNRQKDTPSQPVAPVQPETINNRKIVTLGSKGSLRCRKDEDSEDVTYTWIKDDDEDWYRKVIDNRGEVSENSFQYLG